MSGKKTYPSVQIAEDALIEAHTHFEYGNSGGPIAVYQCEDCGHFHLTSKGLMNTRLAHLIKDGRIGKEKEANRWMDKLKRK